MWSKKAIATLDKHYKPCGPCALCGCRDKRHRLWDSIMDTPENNEMAAREYGVTIGHVQAVRTIRPYRKGGDI